MNNHSFVGFFILLAAIFWWIFISDQPDESRWVSEREKRYIDQALGGETKALKEALKVYQPIFQL